MASQITAAPFLSLEVQPSSTQGSPSQTPTTTSSNNSSTVSDGFSFIGSNTTTVLFFVALAVAVVIGLIFVYFTLRYFVRSRYGLSVSPFSQRSQYPPSSYGNADDANNYAFIHLSRERRRQNRQRRRRRRFSKMQKLTAEEAEKLFPKKTYHDWLNGGKERDVEKRDGNLKEEPDQEGVAEVLTGDSDSLHLNLNTVSTAKEQTDLDLGDGIELKEMEKKGIVETHIEVVEGSLERGADPVSEIHGLQFDSGSCAICLEVLENDAIVRGLICGHVFHAVCLDPWLIKRRACCPMCKRDYLFKRDYQQDNDVNEATSGTNGNSNESNHGTTETPNGTNGRNESEDNDTESINSDEIQRDPVLQAFLQNLIPMSERARLTLSDPQYADINLEERSKQMAKEKYGKFFKIIIWKLFGITKLDLFHWAVLTLASEHRRAQQLEELQRSGLANVGVADTNQQHSQDPSSTLSHTHAGHAEVDVAEATRRDIVDNRV